MPILPTVRPLPYHSTRTTGSESALARALREEFAPKLARRLPGHHLNGLPHGFVPAFVAKHKQAFPYFLKADIAKFYPNVRHTDVVVGCQIAYRDLVGLDHVPSSFKKRYVASLQRWTNELPLTRGIPLGSPVSAIVAPVLLLPVWLEIKRRFNVPLLVWMDDALVLGRDPGEIADIYQCLENRLALDYDLHLNTDKTLSGRFSSTTVEYCGWSFAGGYARITQDKADAFRKRMQQAVRTYKGCDAGVLAKRINRKVDGFGHYYKHGDVTGQFEALDVFIRSLVRQWLCRHQGHARYGNGELERLGLHSLVGIKQRHEARRKPPTPARRGVPVPVSRMEAAGTFMRSTHTAGGSLPFSRVLSGTTPSSPDFARHEELLERIAAQLAQQTVMCRKQLKLLQTMMSNL